MSTQTVHGVYSIYVPDTFSHLKLVTVVQQEMQHRRKHAFILVLQIRFKLNAFNNFCMTSRLHTVCCGEKDKMSPIPYSATTLVSITHIEDWISFSLSNNKQCNTNLDR